MTVSELPPRKRLTTYSKSGQRQVPPPSISSLENINDYASQSSLSRVPNESADSLDRSASPRLASEPTDRPFQGDRDASPQLSVTSQKVTGSSQDGSPPPYSTRQQRLDLSKTAGKTLVVEISSSKTRARGSAIPPTRTTVSNSQSQFNIDQLAEDVDMPDATDDSPLPVEANSPRRRRRTGSIKSTHRVAKSVADSRPSLPRGMSKESSFGGLRERRSQVTRRRKPRLIDALAAQATPDDSDASSGDETSETRASKVSVNSLAQTSQDSTMLSQASSRRQNAAPPTFSRQSSMTSKPGLKFTYSQQRSMLAEDPLVAPLGGGLAVPLAEDKSAGAPFFGLGRLFQAQPSPLPLDDEDDDTGNAGAVRSIHELRQAGANSRFDDEMDDMLDRIRTPQEATSSLRRGALLDLAQKVQDRLFRRQLRTHGSESRLFYGLGSETDLIAGYAILSILVTLLGSPAASTHLLKQLQSHELAQLLGRMLAVKSDITVLAKLRQSNVSRNGQTTLASVKKSILDLSIWDPHAPSSLSPRSLALKCLGLFVRHATGLADDQDMFCAEVTDQLFALLAESSREGASTYPETDESLDLYAALCLLESHSISAMQVPSCVARWTREYLPILANILDIALTRPPDQHDDLDSLILRLVLNTTNNNSDGPSHFAGQGRLGKIAGVACGSFEVVLKSINDDAFLSKALEALVFMLGVMINFCEHYSHAAQDLYDFGSMDGSPLDKLIRVFLIYHSMVSDADSIEKSQLNVAFGYLAILLGYLCLYRPVREIFISLHPRHSLEPLLASIRDFVVLHGIATNAVGGDDARPNTGAAERLQWLVTQLEWQDV